MISDELLAPLRPPKPPARVLREFARLSRAAHRFHRFAHHPLCGFYASETIALGKRARVCRGCALSIAGGLAGALSEIGFRAGVVNATLVLIFGVALAIASFALRGGSKWLTRFSPAGALGFAFSAGWLNHGTLGFSLAASTAAVFVALVAVYRKRGPDRSPCAACPERGHRVCSGFLPIVRRERALQRKVRRAFS